MSYRPRLQLAPPTEWPDFETLCWGLWKVIWRDDNTQKHGRNGQPQNGVDVYGQPSRGRDWTGVQCKGKENFTNQVLTKAEVRREVKKAKQFQPKLTQYIIATTAPRDSAMQLLARKLTNNHAKTGWFKVAVHGWQDIVDLLYEHEPPIASQVYPLVFGGELAGLLQKISERLPEPQNVPSGTQEQPLRSEGTPVSCGNAVSQGLRNTTPISMPIPTSVDSDTRVAARDVRPALELLDAIRRHLSSQEEEGGTTSADASLTDAVDRATGARRT